MIFFAGIDGTGVWNDSQYAREFENSFVHRLYKSWPFPSLRFYHRGPSLTGIETAMYAARAKAAIEAKLRSGEAKGIFLAGYSRGGAAVIEVASWFDGLIWDTVVDCLILFDAVDRSTEVGGIILDTAVGNNVKACLHAKRDPAAGSRESFGNCGTRMNARYYLEEKFFCTHGGVGGVPWASSPPGQFIDEGWPDNETRVTPAMDVAGAQKVWNWMNPKVQALLRRSIQDASRR